MKISSGDPFYDIKRVAYEHRIPDKFHKNIQKELSCIPVHVTAEEKLQRKDLTSLPFITIDGVTARDFDDAIYVNTTRHGFNVLMAIADVSHYVKPNTLLDQCAYQRGNSTYFPNYVIPMLHKKLSHGICSLNPHVERLAFVVDIKLDHKGKVISSDFYEAVVKTIARTTYEEIQSLLDHLSLPIKKDLHKETITSIKKMVFRASHIAQILLSQRIAKKSLNIDLAEAQVIVDDAGYTIDVIQKRRLFSHQIIEELMLLANLAVARFLKKSKKPVLYRVHENPDNENIDHLNNFLKHLGCRKRIRKARFNQQINPILKRFKSTQYEPILNIMVLRTMKQACYMPKTIGHFGLGFSDYVHFTSPIRRYADLIIHRQLKEHLGLERLNKKRNLASIGQHLSACEQRSVKAERQIMTIEKAKFMRKALGQEFKGIITSITRFGLFILLPECDVDGLLKLSRLGKKSSFTFDKNYLYLSSCKSNKVYYVGDSIKVVISKIEIQSGKISFILP